MFGQESQISVEWLLEVVVKDKAQGHHPLWALISQRRNRVINCFATVNYLAQIFYGDY